MESKPLFTYHVVTHYIEDQSQPDQDRYAFSYTITIRNVGTVAATLQSRRWLITDANGKQSEVEGPGVVGKHPHILPNDTFTYTSGAVIETEVGVMQGFYLFEDNAGQQHQSDIPPFRLAIPNILH
ncbi:Co2+/Mg2+ efflux protein ApaG [Thaumasiovibrio subtropicus]|uniref:Co2+/Mg2+ efflux protein ApaG n=1 Tax=Thaumasiovibrio subtropicus TaxID=1891207 RepID=UPI000B34ED6C|nr:Co2+/Mg2+ efflux protein ApaG [Thaumasiovibrio subtropicus]